MIWPLAAHSYEDQGEGLGDYFFDSVFSDVDSLALYGGIHPKAYGIPSFVGPECFRTR